MTAAVSARYDTLFCGTKAVVGLDVLLVNAGLMGTVPKANPIK